MPTISTLHASHEVPDGKLTSLGLYVTAQEAYEMWKADPERVKVLDVRMVEEYVFSVTQRGQSTSRWHFRSTNGTLTGGSMASRSTPISSTM